MENTEPRFIDHLKAFAAAVVAHAPDVISAVLAYLVAAEKHTAIVGAPAVGKRPAIPDLAEMMPDVVQPAARAVLNATFAELKARAGAGFEESVPLAFQEHVVPVLQAAAKKAGRAKAA